ncbi:hypothetical protein GWK47_023966 [Chionoecetes opilio]|uniref:Uncharacterized protein n=1 Tax=Chionoecetes opilio TaxID=41210 RepID=A0A8J5CG37_CHIOP|nr:hypothetical protein GWK47_023966 [Chionoecetes opilio]
MNGEAYYRIVVSANFGYMGMWHATLKPIVPIGCIVEDNPASRSQGGAHKARGLGQVELLSRAAWYEKEPAWDSRVVTLGSGVGRVGEASAPRRMPPMID